MMLKEHYKQPLNPDLAVSVLCHLIEAEESAVERRNAGRGETIGALMDKLWVAWNPSEAKTHTFTQMYHCRANKGWAACSPCTSRHSSKAYAAHGLSS